MKRRKLTLSVLLAMITLTTGAMALINGQGTTPSDQVQNTTGSIITLNATLAQHKIHHHSDGRVGLALTIIGDNIPQHISTEKQALDLMIVLDRSGSMGGRKIEDAKAALLRLTQNLSPQDRLAILTYSNNVEYVAPLNHMTPEFRRTLTSRIGGIWAGGGTNLGGGLQYGLADLKAAMDPTRQRKLILLSDGLANQGIVNPHRLGRMAAEAAKHNLSISTIGVGYDFNEVLLTTLADYGLGNYYFLEDPHYIGDILEREFQTSRNVIAQSLEIRIPLDHSIEIVDAGGFPIERKKGYAVIKPGDLLSGQQRKIFLTLQLPTDTENNYTLQNIEAQFRHEGKEQRVATAETLTISCVTSEQEAMASIDQAVWSEQVVKEEYSRLKEKVANSIREGRRDEAIQSIEAYEEKNRTINTSVGSSKVSENLENEVTLLKKDVEDTFVGSPAAVAQKQKRQAKSLQYESYRVRRDKP